MVETGFAESKNTGHGAFECLDISHFTLVFLFTVWSVEFKCFVQCTEMDVIQQTDSCKVNPAELSGRSYDSSLSEAG